MNIEKIIDGLKAVRTIHNGNYAPQIDEAIKSLKAWDKIKDDIKNSGFVFLSGDKDVECIPVFVVMNIINKHLKESD